MLRQRYRLLQTVGQGGMGAVYVAQDTQLGDRLVAVKEMSMSRLSPQELPQAIEQFRREAHLLASLHHPNLPIIYEYFNAGDRWYVVMSFIDGGTLQRTLEAAPGRRLPVNDVVHIGLELCEVLNYLHSHQPQVVFRDLKPSNIMITPNGTVYLIDFGIARHFKQEQSKDTSYYYSVGYAPPEQYGQSQTGPRSDIYSLGATLHQMLSGHNPSNTPFQFPNLQLIDTNIPAPLARLIAQMLEMNEQQRPASMAEVKAQLEKVQQPTPLAATVQTGGTQDVKAQGARSGADQSDKDSRASAKLTKAATSTISAETNQNAASFWSKVEDFLGKQRIIVWIGFIVLSLAMVWPVSYQVWNSNASYDAGFWNSYSTWLAVAGIGASIVGLLFLLARKRLHFDIPGGIAFTLLGNLVLFTVLDGGVYNVYIDGENWLTVWRDSFHSFFSFVFVFSALLLFLGTRFVLRGVKGKGKIIFGAFLIVAGTIVALIIQNHLDQGIYVGTNFTPHIPLTTLTWLLTITLGLNAIFASRRRLDQDSKQDQAA